ncbi:MAG: hypothetical protein M1822_007457 [Bathelium mastoideum]|nr:MAG: hypothetical protein M1822_007457 [Bathelium mastoideum]
MSTATNNAEFPPKEVVEIVVEVAGLLKERGETISVAETAAGGIISASLLSTPGASQFYKGGLTLYTLESRIAFAGWTPQTISSYAGPTPAIVTGLATHVRSTLQSTYTVSESGTAGPTGGQTRNRKPGYVALAVAGESGVATKEVETGLGGDRVGNMVRFAVEALGLVRDVLNGSAKLEATGGGEAETKI